MARKKPSPTQIQILIWTLRRGELVDSQLTTQFNLANTQLTCRSLMASGYIQPVEGTWDRYKLTDLGQELAQAKLDQEMAAAAAAGKTGPLDRPSWKDTPRYDGAELRAYTGRVGAMDAFSLPSRHFDTLRYRDGREEMTNHATKGEQNETY